jgi:hypothetical protein
MSTTKSWLKFAVLAAGALLFAGPSLGQTPPVRSTGTPGTGSTAEPPLATGTIKDPAQAAAELVNRGIGQAVSEWTHQGIHGQELAERIHRLRALVNQNLEERAREAREGRPRDDRDHDRDGHDRKDDKEKKPKHSGKGDRDGDDDSPGHQGQDKDKHAGKDKDQHAGDVPGNPNPRPDQRRLFPTPPGGSGNVPGGGRFGRLFGGGRRR